MDNLLTELFSESQIMKNEVISIFVIAKVPFYTYQKQFTVDLCSVILVGSTKCLIVLLVVFFALTCNNLAIHQVYE